MEIDERIEKARSGRKIWLSLVEEYQINQSVYVIVIPDGKREFNTFAMSSISTFLERKRAVKAVVLSNDEWVLQQQEQIKDNISLVKYEKKQIDALIQFYCLYEFATNLIVASLKQPAGRLGIGMIGKKGLKNGEIFAGVVYGLLAY